MLEVILVLLDVGTELGLVVLGAFGAKRLALFGTILALLETFAVAALEPLTYLNVLFIKLIVDSVQSDDVSSSEVDDL